MDAEFFVILLVTYYRKYGRDALKRMVTTPESAVKAICKRTGADFNEAMAQRKVWVEETVQYVEELALSDKDVIGI